MHTRIRRPAFPKEVGPHFPRKVDHILRRNRTTFPEEVGPHFTRKSNQISRGNWITFPDEVGPHFSRKSVQTSPHFTENRSKKSRGDQNFPRKSLHDCPKRSEESVECFPGKSDDISRGNRFHSSRGSRTEFPKGIDSTCPNQISRGRRFNMSLGSRTTFPEEKGSQSREQL